MLQLTTIGLHGRPCLKEKPSVKSMIIAGPEGEYVLDRVSMAVKRHYDYNNFYKGKHLIGVASSFRGSVHYHPWCDMVAGRQT